jgi:transaldolase
MEHFQHKSERMPVNPLMALQALGQSVWLDCLHRGMIRSGELTDRILEDDVRGVASNPSALEKAVAGTREYEEAIRLLRQEGKPPEAVYEALVLEDVRLAADTLSPVYDRLEGRDGFVSLEVDPHLAHDTAGTLLEARRLWAAVDRPNLLVRIPATREALPAIQVLLGEGVNVHVALLFGLTRYRQTTAAFLAALESRLARHKPVDRVASVASFHLCRIDTRLDPLLEAMAQTGGPDGMLAANLVGSIAVAQAKRAYRIHGETVGDGRFRALAAHGARPQRLLWAGTGTWNPLYSDIKYVEPLVGRDTVTALPPGTLDAYRDHGSPAPRLTAWREDADRAIEALTGLGIDPEAVALKLEEEGVRAYAASFDRARESLRQEPAVLVP